jgi:hypothetical protein
MNYLKSAPNVPFCFGQLSHGSRKKMISMFIEGDCQGSSAARQNDHFRLITMKSGARPYISPVFPLKS